MHIHPTTRVSATKEAEVVALQLKHVCDRSSRTFPTQRGLKIHVSRWCDGGLTQRSRRGSLADKAVKTRKKRDAEALLSHVHVGQSALENVYSFEYLGARLQCNGADDAKVIHRMAIAQATYGSLSNIWNDHRLSHALKMRTYRLSVCSTLTHSSEARTLTAAVSQHQRLQQPLSPRQDRIVGILPLHRSMTCCGDCATSDTSCPRVGLCDVH